jgi:hypothetical protein
MPYRELNFDKHNVAICMSEVKDMFRMHFDRGCQYVMKRVYAKILAVDFDSYINAGRYQRSSSRRSYRNGYRHRKLLTSIGELDLEIPRDRDGGYRPELFERHKRVDRVLDDTIRQMFLSGVSTRKVGDVLDALCGSGVGRNLYGFDNSRRARKERCQVSPLALRTPRFDLLRFCLDSI